MLCNVVQHLDPRYSNHVLSLTSLGEIGPAIQRMGVPVEALQMQHGLRSLLSFPRLLRRLQALTPDVVHTWMYHADLLGGLASRLAGVPALAWGVRHGNFDRANSKISTRLVVATCAKLSRWVPDSVLICSEAARSVHIDLGYTAHKMVVVPNGFDLRVFHPDPVARMAVREELRLGSDAPLVGLVGRFSPEKNHIGFIAAAGMLHRAMPTAHIVLIGSGVDDTNLIMRRAIQAADISKVTHLLGFRTDMPRLMAALDLLASSSSGESFPNVLGEAMACGVPCAVTDVGDSAYIVGDTGRVVKADDMVGLAAAMESLLALPADERRQLGECARARIAEHFEIGAVVKLYQHFYEELAAKGRRRRRR